MNISFLSNFTFSFFSLFSKAKPLSLAGVSSLTLLNLATSCHVIETSSKNELPEFPISKKQEVTDDSTKNHSELLQKKVLGHIDCYHADTNLVIIRLYHTKFISSEHQKAFVWLGGKKAVLQLYPEITGVFISGSFLTEVKKIAKGTPVFFYQIAEEKGIK